MAAAEEEAQKTAADAPAEDGAAPAATEAEAPAPDAAKAEGDAAAESGDAGEKTEAATDDKAENGHTDHPSTTHLTVTVYGCTGLQHLSWIPGTHDKPYVQCEVKHQDESKKTEKSTFKTSTAEGLDPKWEHEVHVMESWCPGDSLHFTIMEEAALKDKLEGTIDVPAEKFAEKGLDGELALHKGEEETGAKLRVKIMPPGAHRPEEGSDQACSCVVS